MNYSLDMICSCMGVLFQCYFCFVCVEFYLQCCAVRLSLLFRICVKSFIKCALCPALWFVRYFGFHGWVKCTCVLCPSPTCTSCELSEQVADFRRLCPLSLRRFAVRRYSRRAPYLFMSDVTPAVAVAAAVTAAVAVTGRCGGGCSCGCGGGCASCGCGCGCGCRCGRGCSSVGGGRRRRCRPVRCRCPVSRRWACPGGRCCCRGSGLVPLLGTAEASCCSSRCSTLAG